MPEIKNTFTRGRMNKDLDERLIPKGEYLNAMNVEVATSDDDSVGTVQNLLGNIGIQGNSLVPNNSVCVGAITDEATDSLYWLTATDKIDLNAISAMVQPENPIIRFNAIFEYNNQNSPNPINPIFVDLHQVIVAKEDFDFTYTTATAPIIISKYNAPIHVGMHVNTYLESGHKSSVGEVLEIITPNPFGGGGSVIILSEANSSFNAIDLDNIEFTGDVTSWTTDTLITGINIVDDLLFWTDNESEPKKINLSRSKEGTYQYTNIINARHTDLINNGNVKGPIQQSNITVVKQKPTTPITLDMKRVGGINTGNYGTCLEDGRVGSNPTNPFWQDGDTPWFNAASMITTIDEFSFDGVHQLDYKPGDILLLKYQSDGKVLTSDFPIIEPDVRIKLIQWDNTPPQNQWGGDTTAQTEIISVDPGPQLITAWGTSIPGAPLTWAVEKESSTKPLFELKFPRFSYRWKYEDGEYSTFAPWSEIAFLASPFRFLPKEGFNLGMVNNIKELTLHDFVSSNIPLDVVQIDLLYKESDSPNIYIVDTIKPNDVPSGGLFQNPWNSPGSQINPSSSFFWADLPKGEYKITSETIFATVAPNQLLRNWDAVPRKALAQEIIGNRLVYANYTKNFNLKSQGNFTADLTTILNSDEIGASGMNLDYKSIKSIRDYQVGVVYADKYGRETPVYTNKDSVVNVPKIYSTGSNDIYTKINNSQPDNAEFYKFYIKETSSKYHNLVMDRWYDAEDGDIWLSFHSHDRNKVDEETFLYLKRGHDGSLVKDDYKYKILSIKNEAPEFIRKTAKQFGIKPNNVEEFGLGWADFGIATDTVLYNNAGNNINAIATNIPKVGEKDFAIIKNVIEDSSWHAIAFNTGPFGTKLKVRFLKYSSTVTATHRGDGQFTYDEDPIKTSAWYKIDKLKALGSKDYTINLNKPLENDALFVNPLGSAMASYIGIEITEELAENLPEFDGRFFVKILTNTGTQEHITSSNAEDVVVYSQPLYYYEQEVPSNVINGTYPPEVSSGGSVDLELFKHNNNGGYGSSSNTTISLLMEPNGNNYNEVKAKWDAEFGDGSTGVITVDAATAGGPKIFIDKLKAQGSMVGTRTFPSGVSGGPTFPAFGQNNLPAHGNTGPFQMPGIDVPGKKIYISIAGLAGDNKYHFPDGTAGLSWLDSLDYDYHWFGMGLYPQLKGYIPGGTMRDIPDVLNTANFYMNNGDLGTNDFVSNIKVGGKFRFSKDTDQKVYTINAIKVFWSWNYLDQDLWLSDFSSYTTATTIATSSIYDEPMNIINGYDGGTATNGTTPNYIHNCQHPTDTASNRRVTYELTLDKGVGDSGSYDPTASDCTALVAGSSIEFLGPLISGNEFDTTSETPAVWETEPKEVSDIDIYYQASRTYPMIASPDKIANIFSIGDIITSDSLSVNLGAGVGGARIKAFSSTVTGNIEIENINYSGTFSIPANSFIKIYSKNNPRSYIKLLAKAVIPGPLSPSIHNTWINIDQWTHNWGRTLDWHNCYSFGNGVESDTIRDDYNQVIIDNGVTASTTVGWSYENERLKNGLIFSGLYNNKTSLNDLNQFIEAENITKDLNPSYGSIQKLHTRDSDLIAFCEDKVIKILANKDALYNADENSQLIATNNVLGQAQPFIGDWGISTNPESFAKENFRSYFVDRKRGAVLRLSRDGLTAISENGMKDWFRDSLSPIISTQKIHGSYDTHKSLYNITIPGSQQTNETTNTISFNENSKGWPSFKSFIPEKGISMNNDYFTFHRGSLYKHHVGNVNSFYNTPPVNSSLKFVFNEEPSMVKSFTTINYEGTQGKILFRNDDSLYTNLFAKDGWYVNSIQTDKQEGQVPDFVEKEGKWFNNIIGISGGWDSTKNERLSRLDTREFSFQGIENLSIEARLLGESLHYSNCDGGSYEFNAAVWGTVGFSADNSNVLIGCPEVFNL